MHKNGYAVIAHTEKPQTAKKKRTVKDLLIS